METVQHWLILVTQESSRGAQKGPLGTGTQDLTEHQGMSSPAVACCVLLLSPAPRRWSFQMQISHHQSVLEEEGAQAPPPNIHTHSSRQGCR